MFRCEGSLADGSACQQCERCVTKSKELLKKYGRTPADKITKSLLRELNNATSTLVKKLGTREFQKLIRGFK